MAVNKETYLQVKQVLDKAGVTLIAVSKTKPIEDIRELYELGQRDFGENYVQELVDKQALLPADIRWHFIGHLQSNKVKYIAPFVHLIHGVDSYKLLTEINKQAVKLSRVIQCLLQVHIAVEETKFGFDEEALDAFFDQLPKDQLAGSLKNVDIKGLMGMASFTEDSNTIKTEFAQLKAIFDKQANSPVLHSPLSILSMGMSADYAIAIEQGSTMVRIGSLLFGARQQKPDESK